MVAVTGTDAEPIANVEDSGSTVSVVPAVPT